MTDMQQRETERMQARARLKRLAAEYTQKGDPTGWFDVLYQTAAGNTDAIPWADLTDRALARRKPPSF